ncbi:MAG: 16S rRNA (guanine(527)-N(7))-methyltransferase RsmG, partial [Plesiomonas shigelloides]
MLAQTLDRLLAQTALSVSDQQKQQLLAFVGLLDKWNKAYNLTSVRDPQEML